MRRLTQIASKLKFTKWEYLLVVFIILLTAKSTPLTRSIYAILIPFFIALFLSVKKKIKINRNDYMFLLVFFVFILAYLIKYSFSFDPLFTFRYSMLILTVMLTVRLLGFNFFILYERIVYFLVPVDIVLYVIQLLFPSIIKDVILGTYKFVFGGETLIGLSKEYGSILIYTVNTSVYDWVIPGNAGFAWEHGPFGSFLVLALFIHLATNSFKIDKKIWIYTMAIITTLSTTAYAAYFVLLALLLHNKKSSLNIVLAPLFISIAVFSFVTLPFLSEKVVSQLSDAEIRMNRTLYNYQIGKGSHDRNISIGRFSGLLLNWQDFINNPIIGYGGHSEVRIASKMRADIHSTNGLGNWLAQFGAVGMILLLISMQQSAKLIFNYYRIKGYMFFILILLIIFFAFSFISYPLFFLMVFFSHFYKKHTMAFINNKD